MPKLVAQQLVTITDALLFAHIVWMCTLYLHIYMHVCIYTHSESLKRLANVRLALTSASRTTDGFSLFFSCFLAVVLADALAAALADAFAMYEDSHLLCAQPSAQSAP